MILLHKINGTRWIRSRRCNRTSRLLEDATALNEPQRCSLASRGLGYLIVIHQMITSHLFATSTRNTIFSQAIMTTLYLKQSEILPTNYICYILQTPNMTKFFKQKLFILHSSKQSYSAFTTNYIILQDIPSLLRTFLKRQL